MDIRTIAAADTSVLHLRDGADNLLFDGSQPVTITLWGPGSKAYVKAQTEQSNRMVDRLKKKGKTDLSADDKLAEQAAFLAACTVRMDGVERDGLEGHELFVATYSDPSIGFVAEQVAKHLGDWANFTKGSATA